MNGIYFTILLSIFQEVAIGTDNQVTVINEDYFELFMRDIRNGGA